MGIMDISKAPEGPSEKKDLIAYHFQQGLGETNVDANDVRIVLTFDLSNKAELEAFNRLGELTARYKVTTLKDVEKPRETYFEPAKVEVFIPYIDNDPNRILMVANHMDTQLVAQPDGEIHRPVRPNDPEYVLEEITNKRWTEVRGSRYEGHIMAAEQPVVDDETRFKQEEAIAYALDTGIDDRTKAQHGTFTSRLPQWVEHQQKIDPTVPEEKRRTAVPSGWVKASNLARVRSQKSELKEPLSKVFFRRTKSLEK